MPLRSDPGTYVLVLHAAREASVEVGALGTLDVQPGAYLYVGSALGPGGVRARVRRHARAATSLHWHVDYVRAATALRAAWVAYHPNRLECAWAAALRAMPGASLPLPGFGASDCDCPAHLVHFDAAPAPALITRRLDAAAPVPLSVERIDAASLGTVAD